MPLRSSWAAGEVEAAPRTRLGLVAELLERVGLQLRALGVVGSANTTWFTTSATQR